MDANEDPDEPGKPLGTGGTGGGAGDGLNVLLVDANVDFLSDEGTGEGAGTALLTVTFAASSVAAILL